MTLVQRIAITHDDARPGLGVLGLALAALLALCVAAVILSVILHPASAATSAPTSPIAKAGEPVCAHALEQARHTRHLSTEDAIAASTAMLRVCDVR